ncbi:hypothetical protein HPB48_017134 [Haemaphysalis longicornis]|uniref:Fibrinogen C-terminal domain-containing protein n=1 Tax=Haemaphysalis longicornis TaxID=44386 RepID=A0A9J6GZC6_HAELO|nr:hypothetical protein HPB48_017134 [Haemaphysalis longicornis]
MPELSFLSRGRVNAIHGEKKRSFIITVSKDDYVCLLLLSFQQTGWDALTRANGQPFQTFDRDTTKNNEHVNCASVRRGAWWYTSNCEGPNLTGVNFNGKHIFPGTGIQWLNHSFQGVDWSTFSHPIAYMMIKPTGSGRKPLRL